MKTNQPIHNSKRLPFCTECSLYGYEGEGYCFNCGKQFENDSSRNTAQCSACGNRTTHPMASFCPACGTRLHVESQLSILGNTMKTFVLAFLLCLTVRASTDDVLQVRGRFLTTPCGDTVVLRGVNKMCIYDANDFGIPVIPEIKKTGANVLRIVWDKSGSAKELDRVIQATIDNAMIPMVEMHDATGDWNALPGVVDYWLRTDILAVVKKHSKYILVNVANEPGDFTVSDKTFLSDMMAAITRFRNAGVTAPLILDATGYGQNIDVLLTMASYLTNHDPRHNVMYSVHLYWDPKYFADRENLLMTKLENAVTNNIPLIVGEFTGCYTDDPNSTDDLWKVIIEKCAQYNIGWLPWEWGPGNGIYEDGKEPVLFPKMDITSDGTFDNIKDGWAKEVVLTSQYSIKNTSVTPEYIVRKGECPTTGIDEYTLLNTTMVSPNPANGYITIHHAEQVVHITITNSIGEQVCELNTIHNDCMINTQGLASGVYTITIRTATTTINRSILIQH